MNAHTFSSTLDRWTPMIAAAFTGLAVFPTILAAVSAHWGYALAGLFATLFAANWWGMAQRSLAAREEVDRLATERAKTAETARHMGDAMAKVGNALDLAVRTAATSGDAAGMAVVLDFMSDADMLPPAAEIATQAGSAA